MQIEFKVGDFVEMFVIRTKGLVWKIDEEGWPCVILFDESLTMSSWDIAEKAPSSVDKIKTTKTLRQHGRHYVKKVWNNGWLDNLSYIELLDILKPNAR